MNQDDTSNGTSVRQALEEVAQSGRQLMVNQIALVGAEAREGLDSAVNRLIEAFVAILLGFCGFVVLTVASIRLLEQQWGQPIACGVVGGVYLVASIMLARMSARKRPFGEES